MKKIEAVIRPESFSAVKTALEELNCPGITISEVKGHGKQKGLIQQWRGQEYKIEFLPKVKLEIVVENNGKLPKIIDAIVQNSRTGQPGDGKIWILPVEKVIRISTGEEDKNAI